MRTSALAALSVALFASAALGKLPPLADDAKAKAAEAAAKSAWTDKVGLFQLCKSMDRVAATYRSSPVAAAKPASAPDQTPACADPGAYVSQVTPAAAKPLEASGAHSPAGMATAVEVAASPTAGAGP